MYKSKSPSLSTSARALDVDPGLFSFDSNFFSTKIPFPSFINTLFGPPSAVTIKSKSLSPSMSEKNVKEAGLSQLHGKEYIVEDGDCIYFHFNV